MTLIEKELIAIVTELSAVMQDLKFAQGQMEKLLRGIHGDSAPLQEHSEHLSFAERRLNAVRLALKKIQP